MSKATCGKIKGAPRLSINEDSVIYVVAPAKVATGGPELLHQLVYHLRNDLGYTAYMYYFPATAEDPIHPAYRTYNNPFVREITDSEQNLLIVPEVIWAVKILKKFRKIQKIIWWLSVNNFFISYILGHLFSPKNVHVQVARLANKIANKLFNKELIDTRELILAKNNKSIILKAFQELDIGQTTLHLCQSYYAMEFLASFSINNVAYLSDYLNKEFLSQRFEEGAKEDIVVFNPKKGYAFTRRIIAAAPNINFVPIKNMTRSEVIELLKKAKVYIDFGDHPGKDRIPREAAILGCCVIVGKRGSAANDRDVPIPEKYKFEVRKNNIPRIIETIESCLHDYANTCRDFDGYRNKIKREPDIFLENLKAIFGVQKELGEGRKRH